MKKLVMTVAVLGCVASFASAQVTSVNTVGYTKVEAVGGELTLGSLNFNTGGGVALQDLIGTSVPGLSIVYKWDKSTDTYAVATLNTRGAWGPNLVIDIGDAFFIQAAGTGTNEVILSGEVKEDDAEITLPAGIRATGYYFPVSQAWTATEMSADLPGLSVLYTWDEVGQSYNVFTKNTRGAWSGNPVIAPAEAFFVDNPGAEITSTNSVPF